MKRFILLTLALLVCGAAGWLGYRWYQASQIPEGALAYVPDNAIYVIETNQPVKSWKKISGSATWKHLQQNAYFAEITSSANSLDSLLNGNSEIFDLLGSRPLLISAHMISYKDYDFIFVADLHEAAGLKNIEDYIFSTLNLSGMGYSISSVMEEDQKIYKLYDHKEKSTLYLSFTEKDLIASYQLMLIKKSLQESKGDHNLAKTEALQPVLQEVSGKGAFRVYLNTALLPAYTHVYMDLPNEYVNSMSRSLSWMAFSGDLEEERIKIKGRALLVDSVSTYIRALGLSGSGTLDIPSLCPDRTSFYMGLGFNSLKGFLNNFEALIKDDVKEYEEYKGNTEKVEKYLKIDLEKNFMDWVDDEVAFVQLATPQGGAATEFAVVVEAADIQKAEKELDFISKQVRKKTPVKFKEIEYKEKVIHFLAAKGLFKAILGKFFAKLDKPYYTTLGRYVVFSNNPETIKGFIDTYSGSSNMTTQPGYQDFISEFNNHNNLFVYMHLPALFPQLAPFVGVETWSDMQKNKDYITCFDHIGFQLVSDGKSFESSFVEQFRDSTEEKDAVNDAEPADTSDAVQDPYELPYIYIDDPTEKMWRKYYSDSSLELEVELKYGFKEGDVTWYYPDGSVKMKGHFKKDQKAGTWKYYDMDGNVAKREEYD